jgi:cytochrome c553
MLDQGNRRRFDGVAWAAAVVLATASVDAATAGDHRYLVNDPTYRTECGSCHVAYPPALLGAGTWREVMRGLDRHFGTDASLPASTEAQVRAFLEAGAGKDSAVVPTLRISETRWFRNEHRREVDPSVWKSAAVKSPANCGACHRQADAGDYDERSLRLPGGESR